jgi:Carboxypeptidase regulatory-like domain
MKVCAQLAGLALLIGLGAAPLFASPASVTGLVRDSAGVPQIGAQVQLLRPDLSVVTSAYTNREGRFTISSILPGHYALKAMNESFLPSLREDVRVRTGRTVVNLTLNTLYEVMQWLPAQPRSSNARSDDWTWTLRSAANRPLLRWLEDGPLVVVSDGRAAPRLKARLMATGQAGSFGESGQRFSASVEDTPQDSRELLARVDFDPGTDSGMESTLGFRQDLGYAGSVQSVAAIAVQPAIQGAGSEGLMMSAMRSAEDITLGPVAEVEAGAEEVLGRTSEGAIASALPFASVAWHPNDSMTVRYRMASAMQAADGDDAAAELPRASARGGQLQFEHGLHQEIGVERRSDSGGVSVLFYADRVDNPVLEANASFAPGTAPASLGALFDPQSGLMRATGNQYSSTGVQARIDRKLPGGNLLEASYTNGKALVMPALPQERFSQMVAAVRAQRAQSYSISLSGTLEGTQTRWRASYRWQPDDTLTSVAPFAVEALAPYLNVRICQGVRPARDGSVGLEALVEVQNLLAQGYHPFLMSDGSILIFAQGQRVFRGGLAFTF